VPAGPVRGTAVAMRQQLARRHLFVPFAEGTAIGRADRHGLETEISGPLAPFSRDDHPAAGDRILTEFAHEENRDAREECDAREESDRRFECMLIDLNPWRFTVTHV